MTYIICIRAMIGLALVLGFRLPLLVIMMHFVLIAAVARFSFYGSKFIFCSVVI